MKGTTAHQTCSLGFCTKTVNHNFTGDNGDTYSLNLSGIGAFRNGVPSVVQMCWSTDSFVTICESPSVTCIDDRTTLEVRVKSANAQ